MLNSDQKQTKCIEERTVPHVAPAVPTPSCLQLSITITSYAMTKGFTDQLKNTYRPTLINVPNTPGIETT